MQGDTARLRGRFREGRAALFQRGGRPAPCGQLFESYTSLVDEIVGEIHGLSCRFADSKHRRESSSGLAIVATGGFGRRELNPFSDIDIAFIPSEEEDPWVESAVHLAFKLVMDVFLSSREVRVGYSYRPIPELATWDTATLTALLDARLLCGDPVLPRLLAAELRKHLSPLDLVLEIRPPGKPRSANTAASMYSVEPGLKEGTGSLRDLHRGRWIFKLLLGEADADPVAHGLISRELAEAASEASRWFWNARNWLHITTGKRSDVVTVSVQDRIARELGDCRAGEWLARHFAHAEALVRFRDVAVRAALKGPLDLGGVRLRDGNLEPGAAGRPRNAMRLLHLAQRYALPLSLETEDALEQPGALDVSELPDPSEGWEFLAILNEPRGVSEALRRMTAAGLLDCVIPEYSKILRSVPPDPAHRYTIGEHSIRIVEHLESLRERRDPRDERFSELLAECSHFDVLCLAALLHDAGKVLPGTDHSLSSAAMAAGVTRNLQLAPEKSLLLDLLIRHHLLLVRTARLHDLKSAPLIQQVAEKCGSVEALRHLYVFSYVDTRAVSSASWTSMDFRDLEELYARVFDQLSGRSPERLQEGELRDRIVQVRRRLTARAPELEDEILAHCETLPAGYILNTPLDEIALHLQLIRRLDAEGVVLDVFNRPGDDFTELTICAYDDPQPGMLAKITGVLFGCGTDIHKAQVYTVEGRRPVALDTLWVRSSGHPLSDARAGKVKRALQAVLSGRQEVEGYLKAVGKHPPIGIPLDSIELRNDLSAEHTVVHVVARDLQGLLFLMTRTISRAGLHIHSAKVATWNARAENNFYVTTRDGVQVPDLQISDLQQRLSRTLRGSESE